MKIEEKARAWAKEHEGQIKAAGLLVGTATFGFVYGYLIRANKAMIDELRITAGWMRYIDNGAMALLDPRASNDIKSLPVDEWCKITNEYFGK